jgi:hypothetical protein
MDSPEAIHSDDETAEPRLLSFTYIGPSRTSTSRPVIWLATLYVRLAYTIDHGLQPKLGDPVATARVTQLYLAARRSVTRLQHSSYPVSSLAGSSNAGFSSFVHLLADGLLDSNRPTLLRGFQSEPVRALNGVSSSISASTQAALEGSAAQ